MLVLSRKRNEQIVIGGPGKDQVVITIVDIRGDKVRLGIDADKEKPVHRREVYEAIHGTKGGRGEIAPKPKPGSQEGEGRNQPVADSAPATPPEGSS